MCSSDLNAGTYLLESWIDHTAEYTMLAATDGENVQVFPAIELMLNADEQLLGVKTPANLSADISQEMERIVTSVAEHLQYRGVFRVDFYVTATGNLYVHGIEPGVNKNSKTPRNHLRLQSINHGLYVLPTANRDVWRSEERRVGKECRSRWSP